MPNDNKKGQQPKQDRDDQLGQDDNQQQRDPQRQPMRQPQREQDDQQGEDTDRGRVGRIEHESDMERDRGGRGGQQGGNVKP